MIKIKRKYFNLVFSILLAFFMSFIMSFVLTLINTGFIGNFFLRWGRSFIVAIACSFPVSLIIVPIIRKFLEKIIVD
ncbi:MAG: hypothetical protein A2086_04715 [Spirochaetes bacterium GWD1_27_9]|nr:MAG: hypothetical protein A2Z98_05235 [Spirochaetes bacterium GWB1_27_13]OHD25324.1 MAG: hypothetical protein A2Y34_03885 [Spirochaetes bacterium GWC1_27_15]OHD29568.1 MAG: hypothetical protein A2086_04715 [Spirochaetes bacterium GWD1_27_9]